MTAFDGLTTAEKHALEQAAAWRVRLIATPSLELSAEFQTWIANADNHSAYDAVTRGDTALGALGSSQELMKLRDQTRKRVCAGRHNAVISRRNLAKYAATLAGLGLMGGSGAWYYLTLPTTYSTDTGQRRKVKLSDGSVLSLDSNTVVEVSYSKNARNLNLVHGQARFDVAHDKARPFSVTAGTETVVAVGTSFNVEKLDKKVLVTLIHGSVVVKNAENHTVEKMQPKKLISLDAGQELEVVADARPVIKKANIAATTAWITGQLIFHDTRLADAVQRENRYTENPMVVSPEVSDIHINGVFNAGDIASFVNAVTTLFPVQATTNESDQIVLVPKT